MLFLLDFTWASLLSKMFFAWAVSNCTGPRLFILAYNIRRVPSNQTTGRKASKAVEKMSARSEYRFMRHLPRWI